MSKCQAPNCNHVVHSQSNNNNGYYCCNLCMQTSGKTHGPLCEKLSVSNLEVSTLSNDPVIYVLKQQPTVTNKIRFSTKWVVPPGFLAPTFIPAVPI